MGICLSLITSCGEAPSHSQESETQGVGRVNAKITPAADAELANLDFMATTPTGTKIFKYALGWKKIQLKSPNKQVFAQKTMCATNVTEVYEEVFGSKYSDTGVGNLMADFRRNGSYEVKFVGDTNAKIVAKLNQLNANLPAGSQLKNTGLIPTGTILSGCTKGRNCLAGGPDEHVGMIGDAKVVSKSESGEMQVVYYAWHNNWLRNLSVDQRNRNLGFGLGKVNDYALPPNFASLGFEREWEKTPWLMVKYNKNKVAVEAQRILPELDDLDPGNGGYEVFLVVPAEIKAELAQNKVKIK
jgi:hypothetical protein